MNPTAITSRALHRLSWLTAILTVVGLVGCSGSTEPTGKFVDVPSEGWAFGENFIYPGNVDSTMVGVPDSTRIIVAVRHTNDYEYANLWLALTYRSQDSVIVDTVNMKLSDDFGKWYGHGTGLTVMCYDTITLRTPRSVSGDVRVRHIMRVDTLRGIEQVGVLPVVTGR
ncbi:MAG: gliding motility lipoprotein GldH [Muribaculaceae bacterium]|nr:gliding motility lipoprotein GldH [Muribaculaceae bacterium]